MAQPDALGDGLDEAGKPSFDGDMPALVLGVVPGFWCRLLAPGFFERRDAVFEEVRLHQTGAQCGNDLGFDVSIPGGDPATMTTRGSPFHLI